MHRARSRTLRPSQGNRMTARVDECARTPQVKLRANSLAGCRWASACLSNMRTSENRAIHGCLLGTSGARFVGARRVSEGSGVALVQPFAYASGSRSPETQVTPVHF